jgi:hypothetical protein
MQSLSFANQLHLYMHHRHLVGFGIELAPSSADMLLRLFSCT